MENCELVGAGEASGVAIFAHLGVRCPAASLMDGATARVEVYRVPDDEAMAGLDKLECYPEWYNRDLLPITLSDSGAKTKAWLVRERAWPRDIAPLQSSARVLTLSTSPYLPRSHALSTTWPRTRRAAAERLSASRVAAGRWVHTCPFTAVLAALLGTACSHCAARARARAALRPARCPRSRHFHPSGLPRQPKLAVRQAHGHPAPAQAERMSIARKCATDFSRKLLKGYAVAWHERRP